MDKQNRRRKSATKAPVSECPETIDEPPCTEDPARSNTPNDTIHPRPSLWDIRVRQITAAEQRLEAWFTDIREWGNTNREATLRYAAHGAVLAAIVAALGLSQAHLADMQLPALARRVSDSALVSVADAAATNPEAEMYARRAVVPRTVSAAKPASPAASPQVSVLATSSDILEAKELARSVNANAEKAAAPAAAVSPGPSLDSLITAYTIQNGDTLLGIATTHNLSLDALVVANPSLEGQVNHLILPGDELRIPPAGGILHIVEDGDTLDKIAQKYEVDGAAILGYAANRLKADSQLTPNQLVFVPGAEAALPAPTPAPESRQNTLASVLQPRAAAPQPQAPAKPAAPTPQPQQQARVTTPPAAQPKQPARSSAPIGGSGNFRYPIPGGYLITTYFSGWHPGVDFAIAFGTPVYAADGGRVTFSGWDNTGYGYCIIIDHGNGFRTRYAHLSWIFPNYGQYVQKGEQIGKVGSTGHSTGPHLHFEIILNGVARNPFAYIG